MNVSSRKVRFGTVAAGAIVMASMIMVPCVRASQDASTFVANVGTRGIQALRPEVSSSDRLARFQQLLQEAFDLPGIGMFALGRYRLSATAQEQQEFFRLYPDFTVRAFSIRLREYGGSSFRVIGTRAYGGETVVNSEIVRTNGSRGQLDCYLAERGNEYRITDVTVGGVSMKVALRDQFASWIENNGGRTSALLAVLRQQNAQLR